VEDICPEPCCFPLLSLRPDRAAFFATLLSASTPDGLFLSFPAATAFLAVFALQQLNAVAVWPLRLTLDAVSAPNSGVTRLGPPHFGVPRMVDASLGDELKYCSWAMSYGPRSGTCGGLPAGAFLQSLRDLPRRSGTRSMHRTVLFLPPNGTRFFRFWGRLITLVQTTRGPQVYHSFHRRHASLIRPLNYPPVTPGSVCSPSVALRGRRAGALFSASMGRLFMDPLMDCLFRGTAGHPWRRHRLGRLGPGHVADIPCRIKQLEDCGPGMPSLSYLVSSTAPTPISLSAGRPDPAVSAPLSSPTQGCARLRHR